MYDPATARFLSKDPIEYAGGDPNLYRYAANDPINHTDPSGHRILVDPNKNACVVTSYLGVSDPKRMAYEGATQTYAGDILRDEIEWAYGPSTKWEGQRQPFTLPARTRPSLNGRDYWQIRPYIEFGPGLWSALTNGVGNGKAPKLAGDLANAIGDAAKQDKVINPSMPYGKLGLSWDTPEGASVWHDISSILVSLGASQSIGEFGEQALRGVKTVAQIGLVKLAEVAGVDLKKLLEAVSKLGDIVEAIVSNPKKVAENLSGGTFRAFEEFFGKNVLENIQGGFKDWVTRYAKDVADAFEKFPSVLSLQAIGEYALELTGLTWSGLKDLIYSAALDAVPGKSAALAAKAVALLFDVFKVSAEDEGKEDEGAKGGAFGIVKQVLKAIRGEGGAEIDALFDDILGEFGAFAQNLIVQTVISVAAKVLEAITLVPVKTIYDGVVAIVDAIPLAQEFFEKFVGALQGIVGADGAENAKGIVLRLLKDNLPLAIQAAVIGLGAAIGIKLADVIARLQCIIAYIKEKVRAVIRAIIQKLAKALLGLNKKPKRAYCNIKNRCGDGKKEKCAVPMPNSCRGGKAGGVKVGGKCFVMETRTLDGIPIGDVELGAGIDTWATGEPGWATACLVPDTRSECGEVAVWMAREQDGVRSEIGLIRSTDWLDGKTAGDWVELDQEEMGAAGQFQVVSVSLAPAWTPRPGRRRVTGLFRFSRGAVYDLWVEGESGPIGVTAGHPFWSVDREDWIPAERLLEGERLATRDGGVTTVRRWEYRGEEPVFNLEVDADHCYRVGEQGILVHNTSAAYNEVAIVKDGAGWVYAQNAYKVRTGGQHKCRNYACNLGSLLYKKGADGSSAILPQTRAMVVFGTQTEHAEYQLLDPDFARSLANMLKSKNEGKGCVRIIEIFTERTPCPACSSILKTELPMYDQEDGKPTLYYIVKYGATDAELGAAYSLWFKGG